MNNSRPIVNISLLLGTIIAVSAFFLVFNDIPVQALHKEQQLLESFDDLADFAKAVKSGDEEIEEIPIQSMKAADIYDDADDNLKDCIDQAAEIGDSLTDREVVHCVDDVNYFNNKYSNSTVSTNATSTATTGLADTGADTTSTSNAADTTSTSNAADTTSTSDDSNENNLVDELVKTGKFTEAEAREFVSNNMQSGTGTDTTSDIKTSNADTNTADTETSNADTNTADTETSNADTNTADTETSNADTNTADTETSNADTNTDSSASDDTSSSNNEDNNNQSSNNNSNNPEDYDDLNELVNDIKNGDVDTDKISLSAFQDSGAYQGADQETQDCIDLAGKIGNNLGDQEIVNCSEDPNFYRNEISNNNDNNADDSSNNADDSSNNADDSSNNADDSSNNADDSSNNADDSSNNADDSSNDNNN
jgi:polyhydroxyalkanoate synthesis regulator phasin